MNFGQVRIVIQIIKTSALNSINVIPFTANKRKRFLPLKKSPKICIHLKKCKEMFFQKHASANLQGETAKSAAKSKDNRAAFFFGVFPALKSGWRELCGAAV